MTDKPVARQSNESYGSKTGLHQNVIIHDIQDLASLRQTTRTFMKKLSASLQEQARISWITDFLAREIIYLTCEGKLVFDELIDGNKHGVQISCEGAWLRPMGSLYQQRLRLALWKNGTVTLKSSHEPELIITIWLEMPISA